MVTFEKCGARVKDGGLEPLPANSSAVQVCYVGIDQSYSGFAVTAVSEDLYHTWSFASKKRGTERLAEIRDFLVWSLTELKENGCAIAEIAMEGYAFNSQMANMLGELGGMVKLTLWDEFNFEPMIVPPTSLKKYASGKGNVKKNEILLAVYKNWGVEFTDDNMADSFVLAHIASGKAKYAYQQEVLTKLAEPAKSGGLKNRETP